MTDNDTVQQVIKEARELSEKATPGPWQYTIEQEDAGFADEPEDITVTTIYARHEDGDPTPDWDLRLFSSDTVDDDEARFVARSRSLIPQMADIIEEQQREIRALTEGKPDSATDVSSCRCPACLERS